MPSLLLGDDVFEIWVGGFEGLDGVGADCVDGDPFVGVIAKPEGLGWGIRSVSEFVGVFRFLDNKDIWVMGKDGGVFVSKGALTVPGDEGHGINLKKPLTSLSI